MRTVPIGDNWDVYLEPSDDIVAVAVKPRRPSAGAEFLYGPSGHRRTLTNGPHGFISRKGIVRIVLGNPPELETSIRRLTEDARAALWEIGALRLPQKDLARYRALGRRAYALQAEARRLTAIARSQVAAEAWAVTADAFEEAGQNLQADYARSMVGRIMGR